MKIVGIYNVIFGGICVLLIALYAIGLNYRSIHMGEALMICALPVMAAIGVLTLVGGLLMVKNKDMGNLLFAFYILMFCFSVLICFSVGMAYGMGFDFFVIFASPYLLGVIVKLNKFYPIFRPRKG